MTAITAPATRPTTAELVDCAGRLPAPVYAAVVLGGAAWYGLTWWMGLPVRRLVLLAVVAVPVAVFGLAVGGWLAVSARAIEG